MAKAPSASGFLTPASVHVEQIALDNSSAVFVYDLAEEAGFGAHTLERGGQSGGHVISMQTRAGAGLNLVGRLSEARGSDVEKDSIFTAYNTPEGMAAMATSLHSLPEPTARNRLVLQVPNITTIGQSLEITPTLAPLNSVLNSLPDSFSVLFSSTPQELVDLSSLSYVLSNYHVIHVFDQYSAGRELGHSIIRRDGDRQTKHTEPHTALPALGYNFFDYIGSKSATDVFIMLNGPLSSLTKPFVKESLQTGLVVVRVLKPWEEGVLLSMLPDSVRNVYVFDEVQAETNQGYLYTETFAGLFTNAKSRKISVKTVKLLSTLTQHLITSSSSLSAYLGTLLGQPQAIHESAASDNKKRLLFFGTSSSTLETLPIQILSSFFGKRGMSAQCLTDYDVLSKSGGIMATRGIVSLDNAGYTPVSVELPLGAGEVADFVAVLDQNIMKTHTLLDSSKPGSVVLLLSGWSASEAASNLPSNTVHTLQQKGLKLYNINIKSLEEEGVPDAASICAYLAFFRLYLGTSASEVSLRQLAHALHEGASDGVNLDKLNAKAWSLLEEVDLTAVNLEEGQSELKKVSFNAVRPTSVATNGTLPGAYLSSWHEAARHILFPDAFAFPEVSSSAKQDYSLRPEVPDNTFLVTCSVNRRLTPLDYDRNVFHLEFDTSGTGLKYAIGEALGVHGWNDENEVLDFCDWYGVDPRRLITIPVPGMEGRMHTRTVFQSLQQQIDLFGKPPKSFYSALADYASVKIDKLSLQFIGSAEGSSTFKKLSDKDTVTFADILQKYPSAKPPIEVLCEFIGDIKPRHYSIASAQSVVGDRVDLLVVTVDWATPSGKYAQVIENAHY